MDDAQRARGELASIAPELDPLLAKVNGSLLEAESKLLYLVAQAATGGAIVAAGSSGARPAVALGRGSLAGGRAPVFAIGGAPATESGEEARADLARALVLCELNAHVRLIELDAAAVARAWTHPIAVLWLGASPVTVGAGDEFDRWSRHLLPDAFVLVEKRESRGPCGRLSFLAASGQLEQLETVGSVTLYQVVEGADLCATA